MNRESRLQHWPETQLYIRKPEKINQKMEKWALLQNQLILLTKRRSRMRDNKVIRKNR